MQPETAGDPMTGVKWTRKTTERLATALRRQGIAVGRSTVGRLLKQMDFRLRVNHKKRSTAAPQDRDRQFRVIRRRRNRFARARDPIVSIDCKKKELVGNFTNAGAAWTHHRIETLATDFRSDATGCAVPYGLYDTEANRGLVVVGTCRETPSFVTDCVATWWKTEGLDGLPPKGGRFTNRLKVGVRLKPPQGARLRAGSRLARTGDLEPLHILVPLLVLDIGANRRFVDRAHTRAEIPPGPQMLPPVAFPQGWELLLQQPRRPPLDELHQLRRRDLRRRRHQHVDMIRRDRPPDDGYFPRRADLTDQLSSPLRDIPAHHLIPVLRDPHHVILQVRDRVPGVTVFPHFSAPCPPSWRLKAYRLKAVDLDLASGR